MFRMAVDGLTPYKIAQAFITQEILTPRAYIAKTKGVYLEVLERPYLWNERTIAGLLRNRQYCGHIISQKQSRKSFKTTKLVKHPESEWIVVKDMHEALVNEQDFEKVQAFVQTKRRKSKNSEQNIFVGMIKCFDCGYSLTFNYNGIGRFYCNTFRQTRRNGKSCTPHSLPYPMLYDAVLTKVREISTFVKSREGDYEEFYNHFLQSGNDLNNASRKREMDKLKRRSSELENIIRLLYEDRAQGIIPVDRFASLFAGYDTEQKELSAKINAFQSQITQETDTMQNAGYFLNAISKFTEITELTPSLLRELIEKVVVHESNGYRDERRKQRIDIHWRFVGLLK